ncbi:hypothetical protein HV824_18375 [Myxococcus sp. AM009]|uniref:hypothetical protein n=1 Tax=unclassified Myxococcus TaxID=2648731 RepID=UPI0015960AB9|nr:MULTISPECIES: hypothetical protein [unclassified Myxococcus]NVJ00078.1 hypothetical protein [Myxococcus sp. AM009]NVJ18315.1 hypothetical protein [Myxococcus sp. AM010]
MPALVDGGPAAWREANRQLLAQWCFEEMRQANPHGEGKPRVDLGSGTSYVFAARPGAFGWMKVDPASITRSATGMLGNSIADRACATRCTPTPPCQPARPRLTRTALLRARLGGGAPPRGGRPQKSAVTLKVSARPGRWTPKKS